MGGMYSALHSGRVILERCYGFRPRRAVGRGRCPLTPGPSPTRGGEMGGMYSPGDSGNFAPHPSPLPVGEKGKGMVLPPSTRVRP